MAEKTDEKDFEVRALAYILTRHIKAKTLDDAKNMVSKQLIQNGGYSTSLIFEGREIKWLHEKYPRDIGYEPLTTWM
jgi:NifU-like protein involved in Fe-S cluster formation